ncbi:two-component sensor histidine kinase [Anaerocolumna cellulosilytica]|uniref:histidine kinase n=2 Tax=Anaerocolumna cellulosilytica TaxID=433286 RepID=A0A6S6R430_9FIRM|nr:two-component sensor histidine kinase [Anaerocolumna cellulosilytica]
MVVRFQPNNKIDVITINRIVKEVSNNWNTLETGHYKNYAYPFSVLSLADTLLYQSSPDAVVFIKDALERGDTIMNIDLNDTIVGKVIITTSGEVAFKTFQKDLALLILVFFSIFTLCSGLYFMHLHKRIIRPFRDLEEFAKEIANGNLDFTLKLTENNIFGAFTQSFDIMREQLKVAKHQEFLANQSKKELVASLSHDIKTPVTSIKLTSELLIVTAKDDKIKNKLNTIYQKAEQINLLVTDLFHTTLNDLDKLSVTPIDTYSSILEAVLKEADCYDKITMLMIPECMICVDPLRLNQVVANIIYNSYKYANTAISVQFELKGSFLEIKIQDFGKGVEEEELPLLFNKFYRGKNAATESGSGLGLYICKKLVEQMEGEIYCSNNEQGFLTLLYLKLA